jgi:hypothetical protein
LYSQWDEDEGAESEDEAYLTPSEGLSEVEEEDEEAVAPPAKAMRAPPIPVAIQASAPPPAAIPVSPPTTHTAPTTDESGIDRADAESNFANTGPSTIHRTRATHRETRIRKRVASSKADALRVDQVALLPGDVDTCREALTLFLTSKMREAEEILVEKDPDGNRLYLMSGHALLEGLKVI